MTATEPTLEELANALRSAAPTLEPDEQRLVVTLYRALSRGRPVTTAALAAELSVPAEHVREALDRWPGVYRDDDGNVIGFWGLALAGMPHDLDTSDATINTWCALDPFLIAPLLDTGQATVRSRDPITDERITLTIPPRAYATSHPPPP